MKREVYDRQFKLAAVKMTSEANVSVKEAVLPLNISVSSLRYWINEYDEYGESAFP